MSNYVEYEDKIAFHPGYYLNEIIDESRLTQEDFAKRLDTTPKNLSILVRGEQNLSIDMAVKLSRMLGTSMEYWLNLQNRYDEIIAEFKSEKELEKEREIYRNLNYNYFQQYFGLPYLSGKIDEQITAVRKFLKVSTLSVLSRRDMAVSFRSADEHMSESNIIKANTMVQIAVNECLTMDAPKYNKKTFMKAVEYALSLTREHENFYPLIRQAFREAGVFFVILPNIPGSKINGATKKIGNNIMLMVNDRRLYSDTFWFTLLHEIGHIRNEDYGISFEKETGEKEKSADNYAADSLIDPDKYRLFVKHKIFDRDSIVEFADSINRDPAIVLGRLQNDGYVKHNDWKMKNLRHRYKIG